MSFSIIDSSVEIKIALILSLVEVFKYLFGTKNKKAVIFAIASGIVIETAIILGKTFPELIPWIDHLFGGVILGLGASGFYRLTKRGVSGIIETAAKAVASIPPASQRVQK